MTPPHILPFINLSNTTDSRRILQHQQLLKSNTNWNLWSMSSSSLCLSSPKERCQNKSFFHRSSYFLYPVPMQDWWPYSRRFQGFCISPLQHSSDKGLRKSHKSSWNTPVCILSLASNGGFQFYLLRLCFSQVGDDLWWLLPVYTFPNLVS